jgi:HAD superfamily hydrolase (TIGR01509 family)
MTAPASYSEPPAPVFLFDLDGTLIDSVYQHVIAWHAALSRLDIDLSVWRIHRRIGMSGGLFVSALVRETGVTLTEADVAMLQQAHKEGYLAQAGSVRALPGASELLAALTAHGVRWAIATSSYRATSGHALSLLGLPEDTPMITRDLVRHAKPDPDLFLAAAALLDVEPRHAYVVGDSVWDLLAARRAGAIGIGLMSGGYGREELERAPGLSGQGDGDQPGLQGRLRPRLGPHHEAAVVPAVGEHPQLDLARRQAELLHVPASMTYDHGAVGLQARRVTEQRAVLETAVLQVQHADELILHGVHHGPGGLGRLGDRGGLVDPGEITGVGDRDHPQPPGPGR